MKQNSDGYYSKSFYIDLPNGQKKQIKVRGKTKKEVEEKFLRKKIEAEQGLLVINSSTTFSRWVHEWLETYKKPKVTSSTYKDLVSMMDRCFVQDLGAMKISDIRLIHVQQCINKLEGKSESYIHQTMIYIKSCFTKAYENELINRSPCIGLVEPTAAIKQDRRPLTEAELDLFFNAIQTHHRGAFFAIMLACGLRPAEARALTWFNINMANRTISVRQSIQANSSEIKEPKTEAGKRTIPIPDWYMDILKAIPRTDSPYVFPGEKGQPLSKRRYHMGWSSLMRQMDIAAGAQTYRNQIIIHSPSLGQDLTPYNLRHTYATQLAEKGVDPKTAQYLLGHSDISVTMNIYTHVTDKMLEEARTKMNA